MEMMRLGMSEQHVPSSPLSPKHLFSSAMLCSCSSWLTGDPCHPVAFCTVIFPLNLLLSSFKGRGGFHSIICNLYSAYPTILPTYMCVVPYCIDQIPYDVYGNAFKLHRKLIKSKILFLVHFLQFLQKAWHIFRSWREFKTKWIWAMPGYLCNMKRLCNMINKLSKSLSLYSTAYRHNLWIKHAEFG